MTNTRGTSEVSITAHITRYLRGIPKTFTIKVKGGPFQICGLPDILFLCSGRAYFFEVKKPGEKLRKLQRIIRDRLRGAGCGCWTVVSVDEVKDLLSKEVFGGNP